MRINSIEVHNFRGIKECNIHFPNGTRIVIIIGPGDSTKSSLLTAMQWAFWPNWNLTAVDTDFYEKQIDKSIVIQCSFSEFPLEFLSEEKYGLFLRKPNTVYDPSVNDEPINGSDICLTIQLTIDRNLEPKWEIICNRKDPIIINASDRRKLYLNFVGSDVNDDLVWSKNSVLHQYVDSKDTLHDAYVEAMREIANTTKLQELDKVAEDIMKTGKEYGVGFSKPITNKIISQNKGFTTGVGVFEGDVPLYQKGLGSRRLLSMGLNINAADNSSVLLIDEIENGLEPYRIRSLINQFRIKRGKLGQIIITTHSPVVISEAKLDELMFVNSKEGITTVKNLEVGSDKDFFQKQIRSNADSYLAKRLIVCEGKTEIGFIRALDNYFDKIGKGRIAYHGVGTFLGNGKSVIRNAEILQECGYDVCVFMDSDIVEEENDKEDARKRGIKVFDWDNSNSIEEQVFSEATNKVILKLFEIVVEEKGAQSVLAQINNGKIQLSGDKLIITEKLSIEERKNIGSVAKNNKHGWYKRIDLGEKLGDVVFNNLEEFSMDKTVHKIVEQIKEWINNG